LGITLEANLRENRKKPLGCFHLGEAGVLGSNPSRLMILNRVKYHWVCGTQKVYVSNPEQFVIDKLNLI